MTEIEFYLDFSSPYAYIASGLIDDFAVKHNSIAIWKPFVLGAVFKEEGTRPLLEYPKKGVYAKKDIARSAAYYNMPYHHPDPFPVSTITALRIYYALQQEEGSEAAKSYAKAIFKAYFMDNRNISKAEIAVQIISEMGYDVKKYSDLSQDPLVKAELKRITDDALDRGVFGAPFFMINEEPFWGVDRLEIMSHHIKTKL